MLKRQVGGSARREARLRSAGRQAAGALAAAVVAFGLAACSGGGDGGGGGGDGGDGGHRFFDENGSAGGGGNGRGGSGSGGSGGSGSGNGSNGSLDGGSGGGGSGGGGGGSGGGGSGSGGFDGNGGFGEGGGSAGSGGSEGSERPNGGGNGSGSGGGDMPVSRFADVFSADHVGIGFTSFPADGVAAAQQEARFTRQNTVFQVGGQAYFPDTIGVAFARALGLTGRGVMVAIVDDGFRTSHDTFRDTTIVTQGDVPVLDHGTYVASRIAGAEYGIADGAALFLSRLTVSLGDMARDMDAAREAGALIHNNSWIWQRSDAERAAGRGGSLADKLRPEIGGGDGSERAYLAAIDRFAEEGVLVWALENDPSSRRVPMMAGLPLVDERYTRAWIAVTDGAVRVPRDEANGLAARDGDGRLRIEAVELLSQPCRAIAFTCIVTEASGYVASGGSDSAETTRRGTSLATPQVSASLAILKEAFPDAHMHDLRRRLLASANDGFFEPDGEVDFGRGVVKGYSDDYGHGVLDLRAALMPIGRTGFATSDARSGPATATATVDATSAPAPLPEPDIPIEAAVMVAGPGMGDAIGRGLDGTRLVVRDALGGRFALDGASLAAARPARRDGGAAGDALGRFLRGAGGDAAALPARDLAATAAFAGATGPWGAGGAVAAVMADGIAYRIDAPAVAGLGWLDGMSLHAVQDEAGRRTAVTLRQAVAMRPGVGLTVGLSLIDERESLLGLRPVDASAAPRGRSGAISLATSADVGMLAGFASPGRVDVGLSAEYGAAQAARFGAVGDTGSVAFSSLGAAVGINGVLRRGDRIALSASQPMRVERGSLSLALPHEGGGALLVPLSPSGRQVDLALSWGAEFLGERATGGAALHVEAGAGMSFDHGHDAGARAAGGYAGLALRF
jgi:subtilase-type serine protease